MKYSRNGIKKITKESFIKENLKFIPKCLDHEIKKTRKSQKSHQQLSLVNDKKKLGLSEISTQCTITCR